MVDEGAFQRALDANPDNHGCRLVFADWLEEQGDWRAKGYRWMGGNAKRPELRRGCGVEGMPDEYRLDWWLWANGDKPQKWSFRRGKAYNPLTRRSNGISVKLIRKMGFKADEWFFPFPTRRAAEEALCRAILKVKDE